uniref:Putative glycosyltransferase n=1 Tax=viral metagenome TaxID=1070528 RepID=A0A6H1ZAP7_9ZZZZ
MDKPDCGIVATVATDAHVLSYDVPRSYSDLMFNMHPHFAKPGDIPLPYAADTTCHFPEPDAEIDHDAVLIGLHYQQRDQWVAALRSRGMHVIYELGLVFDDYRQQVCRAPIGLNWSSSKDMNQRVFELMAMGRCPVIDRVPDLELVGLKEDVHYLGFDTLSEAVQKVEWALDNLNESQEIARRARKFVLANHTYQHRVNAILKKAGLL